jgi:hypothetical protein
VSATGPQALNPPIQGPSFGVPLLRRFGSHHLAIPLGIAFLGLVLNIVVASRMSWTTDEGMHLRYGALILRGSPDRWSLYLESKMPVTALNALPYSVGTFLKKHGWRGWTPGPAEGANSVRPGRAATVAASFFLCLLVYFYAKSLYGRVAGLFAQLLYVLSPDMTAHGTLVTTDLYVALGIVLFLYCLRRYLLCPNTPNALLSAATLALAQLTKITAVYLYPVLVIVLVSVALYSKYSRKSPYRLTLRGVAVLSGLSVACFLVFVNVGFAFDRTFTPLTQYHFRSTSFQALQRTPILSQIPLPVPYAYVQGFDLTSYDNATKESFGNIVLFTQVRGAQLSRSDGFRSYYLVAYALKEPIGMQVLFLLGLVWVIRRRRLAEFLAGEGPLLATSAVLLIVCSFFNNTQIGIRHILPVLLIFVIVSGGAFVRFTESSWRRKVLLCGCLAYVAASVGSYFPHMIPYFNEIVHDRKMAYRFLADSNLDWEQNRSEVAAFLKSHPGVVLDPPQPVAGWVLVRANNMAGVTPKKADYWLRQRGLKPIAHVGYADFLFFVPQ